MWLDIETPAAKVGALSAEVASMSGEVAPFPPEASRRPEGLRQLPRRLTRPERNLLRCSEIARMQLERVHHPKPIQILVTLQIFGEEVGATGCQAQSA